MTVTMLNRPSGFPQLSASSGIAELLAAAADTVIAMSDFTRPGFAFGRRDVRPGLRYRAIYPDTARTAPTAGRRLGALSMAGVEVRTMPHVPLSALGVTDELAAVQLGISVRTVRRTVARIMHRLGARSRFQAGVKAADRGWLLDQAG